MQTRSSFFLLLVMALAFSTVAAQNHNVGYYEVESYEGGNTIYRLVFSIHVDGVENEPELPGDIPVSWGGGDVTCEGDPLTGTPDCLASATLKPQLQRSEKSAGEMGRMGFGPIDEVTDRIVVVGRRLTHPAVVFIRFTGIVGLMPALGELRRLPDQELPEPSEDEAEECTAEMIGDMGGLLTPEQQQMIADYLNSADAESLWRDSGYDGPFIDQPSRRERAGFLYPDGTFEQSDWDPGPCGGIDPATPFVPPPSMPEGSIMVHTHPYSRNESLAHCSSTAPYRNTPSGGDANYVGSYDNLVLGLIIDANGIIVFTGDYDPLDAPDEAHDKGDEDGKCGFNRM